MEQTGYDVVDVGLMDQFAIFKEGELKYVVNLEKSVASCNCPGFHYHHKCKHTRWVKELMEID